MCNKELAHFVIMVTEYYRTLVLGTIIKGDFDRLALLLVGGGVAVLFITLGIITLTNAGGKK